MLMQNAQTKQINRLGNNKQITLQKKAMWNVHVNTLIYYLLNRTDFADFQSKQSVSLQRTIHATVRFDWSLNLLVNQHIRY